jgi:hypothetical protein
MAETGRLFFEKIYLDSPVAELFHCENPPLTCLCPFMVPGQ